MCSAHHTPPPPTASLQRDLDGESQLWWEIIFSLLLQLFHHCKGIQYLCLWGNHLQVCAGVGKLKPDFDHFYLFTIITNTANGCFQLVRDACGESMMLEPQVCAACGKLQLELSGCDNFFLCKFEAPWRAASIQNQPIIFDQFLSQN